jgi:hypothetical protein
MHSPANADRREPAYAPRAKRVLMVVEAFARAGAERQILALSQGLLQHGYEVHVFELIGVAAGQSSFTGELAQLRIGLTNARAIAAAAEDVAIGPALAALGPFRTVLPTNLVTLCRALALTIHKFQPAIVNSWSDVANVISGFVARSMDVPRIVLGQRVLPPPFWFAEAQSKLYRLAYGALADEPGVTFVNCSAASARAYETWMGLAPKTVNLIYNGFAPSSMTGGESGGRNAYRARLGLPAGAAAIGGLMRFAPEKDPGLWLEAAAAIAAARPDAWFVLGGYGHGAIADELYRRGQDLGIGPRLVMPGVITQLAPFYGALDAFLLTSRSENLGHVLIEAQAAGVPVVAPAVGGIAEAMRDGVTGFVVPDRSAKSLSAAVLRILDDAAWRRRAARKGPSFVARKFGQDRMVRETMAIYRNRSGTSLRSLAARLLAGRQRRGAGRDR